MPRLFTALEIPETQRRMISGLSGGLRNARWIAPENYHITLRFIGDVDAHQADEVADALARIRRPEINIGFDRLGSFGARKPHSVWLGVRISAELAELQGEHERILQRIGLEPERRKFAPHVTIARCRGAAAADVAAWLALHGEVRIPDFTASRFVLFSSKATSGGGPYLVEEAYPLGQ